MFVWCRRIGDHVVNRNYNPTQRWAIIVLSAAVLALGGCGRKGGLDLPPNAPPVAPKGRRKAFVLDPLLD